MRVSTFKAPFIRVGFPKKAFPQMVHLSSLYCDNSDIFPRKCHCDVYLVVNVKNSPLNLLLSRTHSNAMSLMGFDYCFILINYFEYSSNLRVLVYLFFFWIYGNIQWWKKLVNISWVTVIISPVVSADKYSFLGHVCMCLERLMLVSNPSNIPEYWVFITKKKKVNLIAKELLNMRHRGIMQSKVHVYGFLQGLYLSDSGAWYKWTVSEILVQFTIIWQTTR